MKKLLSMGILCLTLCFGFSCSQKQTEVTPQNNSKQVVRQNKSANQTILEQLVNNSRFQEARASERFLEQSLHNKIKSLTSQTAPAFKVLIDAFDENTDLATKLAVYDISEATYNTHRDIILGNYSALRQSIPGLGTMSGVDYAIAIGDARELLDINDGYNLSVGGVAGDPCMALYTSGMYLARRKCETDIEKAGGNRQMESAAISVLMHSTIKLTNAYYDCIAWWGNRS